METRKGEKTKMWEEQGGGRPLLAGPGISVKVFEPKSSGSRVGKHSQEREQR